MNSDIVAGQNRMIQPKLTHWEAQEATIRRVSCDVGKVMGYDVSKQISVSFEKNHTTCI